VELLFIIFTGKDMEQDKINAERIIQFMKDNPYASRVTIFRELKMSRDKCLRLVKLGLVKLPAPMSTSIAATYGRSLRKPSKFRLKGTPNFA
jgi:hypothetical protein